MRLRLSVIDPAGAGVATDVVVEADRDTTVADVRQHLLDVVGSPAGSPLHVDGAPLPGDLLLGSSPLLDGAVVSVGRPGAAGSHRGTTSGFLELHTVGGPDAGHVHRLTPGTHRIGRSAQTHLTVDDPDLSRVHAELEVTPAGITLRDLGSTNGTVVDGVRLGQGARPVTESSRVRLGSTTLTLRLVDTRAAATHVDHGTVRVNRSPRIRPVAQPVAVHLPTPPPARTTPRFPLVAVLLPLALSLPLALVLRSPYALLIGVFSPLMVLGNLVSDRITGRADHRAAQAVHAAELARARATVRDAVRTEQLRRRAGSPDAAEVGQVAAGALHRLWERSPEDADFLSLRVGTADLPSLVAVHDPADGRSNGPLHPVVEDVPVTVPLAELGVVGVAGPRRRAVALVRSMLGQLATLHSPRHLSVVVLAADEGRDWTWTAWLPHLLPQDGPARAHAQVLVGVSQDQRRRRVAELEALLDGRLADRERRPGGDRARVVVLLDGAQRLRAVPGVARLLELGPDVGLHVLCLDESASRLPVECRGTVLVGGEVATRLRVATGGSDPVDDVVADLVADRWAQRLARGLAPLRDATPVSGSALPDAVRLLDQLDLDATDGARVAARWQQAPRSSSVLLGAAAEGPFVVDLARDGPHVLVAGTTGAGKSELLQTLIAGLALANRPDELTFVLVDYKGGAAFAECAKLPHTVGLVTDLDAGLTARALESLGAEIARRERLLADHGATDLPDYQSRRDRARTRTRTAHAAGAASPPPLPRLLLVIDEFRVLAEELPDFITGLVRLAAVGRSLGVHLVLATQRPGGVVSADIKANMNLRLALRVQHPGDSVDVVDGPEAATISDRTPGRAVARLGSGRPVPFQTARVGGVDGGVARVPLSVRRLEWARLGDPDPSSAAAVADGRTDLERVVDAVSAATSVLGVRPLPGPWLAPLPEVLTADQVGCRATHPSRGTVLTYGLLDDPRHQRQVPAGWDLHDGTLGVVGGARSGRTTACRALLASLARQCTAAQAWVYVLDGGGGLGALEDLPHVGAVVPPADVERAGRLLHRLAGEVSRRQDLFARARVGDLAEYHRTGRSLPWVVLAVDGWETVLQAWDDAEGLRCLDALHELLRQGPGVGVACVVTGGRSVVTGRLGTLVGHRLVLRTSDTGDAVMAGVPSRSVPSPWPAGRGVVVGGREGEHPRLVQVALLDPDPSGAAQQAALTALATPAVAGAGSSTLPGAAPALPSMPQHVDLDDLLAGWPSDGSPHLLPLGLGGESVRVVGLDSRQPGAPRRGTPGLRPVDRPAGARPGGAAVRASGRDGHPPAVGAVAPRHVVPDRGR